MWLGHSLIWSCAGSLAYTPCGAIWSWCSTLQLFFCGPSMLVSEVHKVPCTLLSPHMASRLRVLSLFQDTPCVPDILLLVEQVTAPSGPLWQLSPPIDSLGLAVAFPNVSIWRLPVVGGSCSSRRCSATGQVAKAMGEGYGPYGLLSHGIPLECDASCTHCFVGELMCISGHGMGSREKPPTETLIDAQHSNRGCCDANPMSFAHVLARPWPGPFLMENTTPK